MASSAPMNGLFDSRRISSTSDRRTIRSPVDTSRKRVRNMKRSSVLYTRADETKIRVLVVDLPVPERDDEVVVLPQAEG